MPARRQAALALPRACASSSTERRWRATFSAGSLVVRRCFVAVSGMAYPPVCYGASIPYLQDMKVKYTPLGVFEGHSEAVNSADFSPDGEMILTASADGTTRL